jgi:hypothetical protein
MRAAVRSVVRFNARFQGGFLGADAESASDPAANARTFYTAIGKSTGLQWLS